MDYFSFVNDEDLCYSVDMLRLSCHVYHKDCDMIRNYLGHICEEYWHASGFGKYSENWLFHNIWFGLGTLQKEDTRYLLFTFEFNPNKVTKEDFAIIYKVLDMFNNCFTLTRFDLAIDIPYNINNLKFVDFFKRSYSIFYNDNDNKTIYMGKGNGHTKIYNKKIESNLDFELTRFEVTKEVKMKLTDFYPVSFNFPSVSFSDFVTFSDDSTTKALQYALNNGFPFNSLSRTYKSAFKQSLRFNSSLKEDIANKALHNCLQKLINRGI